MSTNHPPERLIFDAVASGDVDAVKSLLSDDPRLIEAHAAWRNHGAAVSWLLEHGADRTRINKYGSTPLETARYFDHSEIIKILSSE